MGIVSCSLLCHKSKKSEIEEQSHSNSNHSSLSSIPSLPSVPSLTPAHYLPSCHSASATLRGHSSPVFSVSLAGNHLLSSSSDGHIVSWPRNSDDNVNAVASGGGAVKWLVVSKERVLFTAHQDHKIRAWRINSNGDGTKKPWFKCVATLPTLDDRFLRLFSASNYVEVRRHKKRTWVHHVDTVSCLALSHDMSLLYSASWDRSFKIWRTSDYRCLESVERAHDDAINAMAVSGGGVVYTGSADKKIKSWKRVGGKKHSVMSVMEKHRSAVNAVALSSGGLVLYSGACDGSVLVWERGDEETMVLAGALRGHCKAILCLAAVGEDLVCSGSADHTVRVWRRSYGCVAVLEGHARAVKCLAAQVDDDNSNQGNGNGSGYVVFSGGLDCEIKVWRVLV